jgi:hypothetical protein
MRRAPPRLVVLCLYAGLLCAWGLRGAELAPQYVIVSAIGPGFTIVKKRVEAGTNMTGVTRDTYPLADATFEDAVLDAAERTLREIGPSDAPPVVRARVSGMLVDDRAYDLDTAAVGRLIDAVRPNVIDPRRARLIIVTPVRAPIQLPVETRWTQARVHLGESAEAGLGYYLDGEATLWNPQLHVDDLGFLAVFANIQLLLVDFDTRAVLGRETSSEAEMFTASRRDASQPWDALTSSEKVSVMRDLVAAKVRRHLPVLLHAQK